MRAVASFFKVRMCAIHRPHSRKFGSGSSVQHSIYPASPKGHGPYTESTSVSPEWSLMHVLNRTLLSSILVAAHTEI